MITIYKKYNFKIIIFFKFSTYLTYFLDIADELEDVGLDTVDEADTVVVKGLAGDDTKFVNALGGADGAKLGAL